MSQGCNEEADASCKALGPFAQGRQQFRDLKTPTVADGEDAVGA
jgi:hypothetical protein